MKKKLSSFTITLILLLGLLLCSSISVFAGTVPTDVGDISNAINSVATSAAVLGLLGALCFAVQVVVQVTKSIPGIYKIPTDLWVIIVSMVICQVSLFGFAGYINIPVPWYYVALTIFLSLVISYISMFGWTRLYALYKRFAKFKN